MKSLVADAKTWKQFCPSLYVMSMISVRVTAELGLNQDLAGGPKLIYYTK